MAKRPEIIKALEGPLDPLRVSHKPGGGGSTLAYLEGRDVIDKANDIFGFDGWSYSLVRLDQVRTDKGVAYLAIVRVKVTSPGLLPVDREDCNVGESRMRSFSDAHQVAATAAVTGALKRALRTFGNQFGNSLYDKEENWQKDFYVSKEDTRAFWYKAVKSTDAADGVVMEAFEKAMKKLKIPDSSSIPKNQWDELKKIVSKKLAPKKPKPNGTRKQSTKEQPHAD